MHRVLVSLALFLLVSSAAHAQYTTATIAQCPNDGVPGVCVVYSGAGVKTTEPAANRYTPRSTQELAETTAARKVALNGFDTTQKAFIIGTVVADPSTTTPTADDVAVTAFDASVQAWRAAKGKNAVSSIFGLQSDIDAAAAVVMSNYSKGTGAQRARFDIILAMIQRVFP